MPGKDISGSAEVSDWTRAWEAVSRLASATPFAVQEIARDRRLARFDAQVPLAVGAEGGAKYTSENDQLARAIAEIERAAAALRRAEPALELWQPGTEGSLTARGHTSVWLLIGAVWISAIALIAGATSAIVYLFG